MCCFFTALLFLGPRFAYLVYWLIAPIRVNTALGSLNFPFIVSLLGLIFVPWTLLMWVMIFPMNGWDWLWLGFGVYGGCSQLHRFLPQSPERSGLSCQRSIQDLVI